MCDVIVDKISFVQAHLHFTWERKLISMLLTDGHCILEALMVKICRHSFKRLHLHCIPVSQSQLEVKDCGVISTVDNVLSYVEVLAPPYEVTETGWGEFEAGLLHEICIVLFNLVVGIRIFFRDPDEQPIDLFHLIKLYPDGLQQPLNSKKVSYGKML